MLDLGRNNEFTELLVLLSVHSPLQVKVARLKPLDAVHGILRTGSFLTWERQCRF